MKNHFKRTNHIFKILLLFVVINYIPDANAFTCLSLGKPISSSETVSVYVNLTPSVNIGQNLIVDLSQSIQCKNDQPDGYDDPIRVGQGSLYSGALDAFTGSIVYYGRSYSFPTNNPTPFTNISWGEYQGWKTYLYLTPISTAGGIAIKSGDMFSSIVLEKGTSAGQVSQRIVWNLYANNNVIVPTGGCDVSARNVTVSLPDYPGTTKIPVQIFCAQNQSVGYFLSGTTSATAESIFTNTASVSPASGIGVKIMKDGVVVPKNKIISMGVIGKSSVDLGLSATYARSGGQVTAGNVQSIVEVTFVYQ